MIFLAQISYKMAKKHTRCTKYIKKMPNFIFKSHRACPKRFKLQFIYTNIFKKEIQEKKNKKKLEETNPRKKKQEKIYSASDADATSMT